MGPRAVGGGPDAYGVADAAHAARCAALVTRCVTCDVRCAARIPRHAPHAMHSHGRACRRRAPRSVHAL
eukprot:NODE_10875_length_294_cov_212.991632.p1 GENE.NODE_10875_length_294_cov_212.991632~~NODE_10875_length_294_cov_212.991632.p1  ORF type:complete len:69 (-),score=3.02 NODE_10875_length_294_cov_212.991632:70-276(-)